MNDYEFHAFLKDLDACHQIALRGKRNTYNAMNFEAFGLENLVSLADTIRHRTYQPSRGVAFIVRDPVVREIFAAPFRDRIVHHYIYEKTIKWWVSQFIQNTWSCIEGRGTHSAISEVYREMREVSDNFTKEAYYIKLDLKGYFMSLNRQALLREALRGLDLQFAGHKDYVYETLRFLWERTILDDPTKNIRCRNYPQDWEDLPPDKSLFNQKPGVGIVIGNLTSQELSNIYLNSFDHYVTDTLGWMNYNRYVDDFVIIVSEADFRRALDDVKRIESYLASLGLTLHPKKRHIQNIRHGLPFLGFTIYPGRIQAGKRLVKNVNKAIRAYGEERVTGETILSYLGILSHYDSPWLVEKILNSLE